MSEALYWPLTQETPIPENVDWNQKLFIYYGHFSFRISAWHAANSRWRRRTSSLRRSVSSKRPLIPSLVGVGNVNAPGNWETTHTMRERVREEREGKRGKERRKERWREKEEMSGRETKWGRFRDWKSGRPTVRMSIENQDSTLDSITFWGATSVVAPLLIRKSATSACPFSYARFKGV